MVGDHLLKSFDAQNARFGFGIIEDGNFPRFVGKSFDHGFGGQAATIEVVRRDVTSYGGFCFGVGATGIGREDGDSRRVGF